MKKLIVNKTERNEAYHEFTYENGKKTPIEKDGLAKAYRDGVNENGLRMLKATEREDIAGSVDGKYVETDEIKCENGVPVVNGTKYNVWGIGEDEKGKYVVISANGEKHYITRGEKTVVSYPNQEKRTADLKVIYEIYSMLI